jgi:vancomycin permeability regulator SanA
VPHPRAGPLDHTAWPHHVNVLRTVRTVRAVVRSRRLRRVVRFGVAAGVLAVLVSVGCTIWLRTAASGDIYTEKDVPAAPVALVLGAQVYPDGTPSPFLAARLEIARQLYADGKVRAILVSGDHMHWEYNEPGVMFQWLLAHGVPTEKIVLDHAGFDTYDSCARANRVFGVKKAIVVTQMFHLPRAVTLCRHLGIDATGVGDETMERFKGPWFAGASREYGAAVKAAYDVVTGRDPVFLGKHETGVDDALRSA